MRPDDIWLRKYGKREANVLPNHQPCVPAGHAHWIESGVWFVATEVPRGEFGGHAYDNGGFELGIMDCPCGCWMLSSSSGGPVDPFGPCPMNPITQNPS